MPFSNTSKEEGKDQESLQSVPYLIQDTVFVSVTKLHIQQSQEVSPFPTCDHRRHDIMAKTNTNRIYLQKKNRLGMVTKIITEWLKMVSYYSKKSVIDSVHV